MAKKNVSGRKPSGLAGIAVTEAPADPSQAPESTTSAAPTAEKSPARPKVKAKEEQPSSGNVGIGDIRKAAAFANTVGGLEKAIALLQILKVAKKCNSRLATANWMYGIKAASKYLLAILMIGVGTLHLVQPEFFVKIMPPYLPLHLELVYLSGIFEFVLGLLLLVPRLSRLAAWGIIALLIAVFPANIYLYQHQELLPAPPMVHLLRLPLQALFIMWAYWHTRPSLEAKSESL